MTFKCVTDVANHPSGTSSVLVDREPPHGCSYPLAHQPMAYIIRRGSAPALIVPVSLFIRIPCMLPSE